MDFKNKGIFIYLKMEEYKYYYTTIIADSMKQKFCNRLILFALYITKLY